MSFQTLDWLNEKFLEKAVRSFFKDESIRVTEFNTDNVGFSEHFASEMIRCKIFYESFRFEIDEKKSLDVVIKMKPAKNDPKSVILADGPLYETEIRMYTETLPALEGLFERNGIECEFAPKLIYATNDPFPMLILQDLKDEGFFTPRTEIHELEDAKLIIQQLAKFHAASFYLAENQEHDFEKYSYSIYQNEYIVKTFLSHSLKAFKQIVSGWGGYDLYLPKIDNLIENVHEIGKKCYIKSPSGYGYNVLNHGDFHMRNLLLKLKQDSNKLEAVKFIDYQISVYCSPVVDISYVWGLIKRNENGNIPEDDLIIFYHEQFVKTLNSLGHLKPPPTLLDLNVELLRHGKLTMILQIAFIPFSFIDWTKMKVEDLMITDDDEKNIQFRLDLLRHPQCERMFKNNMKNWIRKGFL